VLNSVHLDSNPTPLPTSQITHVADQLNRVVYDFSLPNQSPGQHSLTMQFTIGSTVGCFASGHNEAHIFVNGDTAALDTVTIPLSVRCS
jgi:hypothetical protein